MYTIFLGVNIMSFINCDLNCIYQNDGYCHMDSVNAVHVAALSPCIYYEPRKRKKAPRRSDEDYREDSIGQQVNL